MVEYVLCYWKEGEQECCSVSGSSRSEGGRERGHLKCTLSPISDTKISVNAAVKPDFASIDTTADGCPLKKKPAARAQRSSKTPIVWKLDPESGFVL